jgi:hypothetical protein
MTSEQVIVIQCGVLKSPDDEVIGLTIRFEPPLSSKLGQENFRKLGIPIVDITTMNDKTQMTIMNDHR